MREEILVRRLQAGDDSALEELTEMYYPEILKYCRWHAPDRSLAEDAVQETFLKAFKYVGSCGFSGKFRAFLYRIAGNVCIDMKRSKWVDYVPFDELDEGIDWGRTGLEEVEEDMVIRALVKGLEPQCREIVILRFKQNLKLREIGEIMGLPMRTVQSKLKGALRQMERELRGGAGK